MRNLLVLTVSLPWATFAVANNSRDSLYCSTLHADFLRRQEDDFNSALPFNETYGTKHTPYVEFDEMAGTVTVTVGNGDTPGGVYHPMKPSSDPEEVHFVTHVYVMDQNGDIVGLDAMNPYDGVPARSTFSVPEGTTEITAFEFCNLHGLWKGPTTKVNMSAALGGAEQKENTGCEVDPLDPEAWISYHADFVRRQSLPPFTSTRPFTVDNGTKHTPYITLKNNQAEAVITVGNGNETGGVFHVMDAFGQAGEGAVHWITEVYVVDQSGSIVDMQTLDPSSVDVAQIVVEIPYGVTELTAYEWCNLHGLWKGPPVALAEELEGGMEGTDEKSLSNNNVAGNTPSEAFARGPIFSSGVLATLVTLLVHGLYGEA